MKITKAMGRACLMRAMEIEKDVGELWGRLSFGKSGPIAMEAIRELDGLGRVPSALFENGDGVIRPYPIDDVYTALALCAAIAGVKPEDVE